MSDSKPFTPNIPPLPSKFRGITNKRITSQLFYENWVRRGDGQLDEKPLFTLNADVPGYPNFGKIYVSLMDKTGYKISQSHLEDYKHFQALMKGSVFAEAKAEWDDEIDARLEAEALANLRRIASSESKDALTASKALLVYAGKERPVKPLRRAGRPSSDEIKGEMKRSLQEQKTLDEDIARLSLVSG